MFNHLFIFPLINPYIDCQEILQKKTIGVVAHGEYAKPLVDRWNALNSTNKERLRSCKQLKVMLAEVIQSVEKNYDPQYCAHALMGRNNTYKNEIDGEMFALINDLLRTNRYGKSEPSNKTVAKLYQLHDLIDPENSLDNKIDKWVDAAPSDERPGRKKAAIEIRDACYRSGLERLNFSGLGLTEPPPLPFGVNGLDLSGNKFKALKFQKDFSSRLILIENCPDLETLDLSNLRKPDDFGLGCHIGIYAAKGNSSLKHVQFKVGSYIDFLNVETPKVAMESATILKNSIKKIKLRDDKQESDFPHDKLITLWMESEHLARVMGRPCTIAAQRSS